MSERDGSERLWTIALIALAVLFMLTPNIASYRAGFQTGLEAGREQGEAAEKARRDSVNAQLRAAGLCEWPAAFYRAANCGGGHE